MPSQAQRALRNGFDTVFQGYFPNAVDPSETFDLITFNDVLEHVIDPWETLTTAKGYLNSGGAIVAAIPNLQYAPVALGLVAGRWLYVDTGILDRTHLRFFTRETVVDMFRGAGLRIERIEMVNSVWVNDWGLPRPNPIRERIRKKSLTAIRRLWLRRHPDAEFMHLAVRATASEAQDEQILGQKAPVGRH